MSYESLITRFSMYIFLKDAPDSKKAVLVQRTSPGLKNLTIALVETRPNATEDDWARYFLQNLIEIPRVYQFLLFNSSQVFEVEILIIAAVYSYQLLFSYLQLICFYAAKKISHRLQSSTTLKVNYPLEECFLIACEAALKPVKLLKNFNFKANSPVHGYARIALDRIIQNQIAKEQKNRAIKFSDRGLLKQLNTTQLEKALKEYGISHQEIVKHRLAWQAFKDSYNEIYPPKDSSGKREVNPLTSAFNERQLNLIAQRYQQLCDRLKIESSNLNGREIQKLLTTCIQVSRGIQNRQFISIEDRWDVADPTSNSLETIIDKETQQESVELKNIIVKEFEALDELSRKSLLLWLGLGVHQNDFLVLFNLSKQYQVARQFQRYQKKILINALRFYYQQRSQSLSEKEIDIICSDRLDLLKNYLTRYSDRYFASIFEKLVQAEAIDRSNQELIIFKFTQVIEKQLNIQLKQFVSAQPNIGKFVERYLQQNQAILSR